MLKRISFKKKIIIFLVLSIIAISIIVKEGINNRKNINTSLNIVHKFN